MDNPSALGAGILRGRARRVRRARARTWQSGRRIEPEGRLNGQARGVKDGLNGQARGVKTSHDVNGQARGVV